MEERQELPFLTETANLGIKEKKFSPTDIFKEAIRNLSNQEFLLLTQDFMSSSSPGQKRDHLRAMLIALNLSYLEESLSERRVRAILNYESARRYIKEAEETNPELFTSEEKTFVDKKGNPLRGAALVFKKASVLRRKQMGEEKTNYWTLLKNLEIVKSLNVFIQGIVAKKEFLPPERLTEKVRKFLNDFFKKIRIKPDFSVLERLLIRKKGGVALGVMAIIVALGFLYLWEKREVSAAESVSSSLTPFSPAVPTQPIESLGGNYPFLGITNPVASTPTPNSNSNSSAEMPESEFSTTSATSATSSESVSSEEDFLINLREKAIQELGDSAYLFPVSVNRRIPPELLDFFEKQPKEIIGGVVVSQKMASHLQDLLAAAREAGFNPVLGSGYRSYGQQEMIFGGYVQNFKNQGMPEEEAIMAVSRFSAPPGHSEHHTGNAVDIFDASDVQGGVVDWQGIRERYNEGFYRWLRENAHQYGFVISYPKGPDINTSKNGSGYQSNEPWHIMYMGQDLAEYLFLLDYLNPDNPYTLNWLLTTIEQLPSL